MSNGAPRDLFAHIHPHSASASFIDELVARRGDLRRHFERQRYHEQHEHIRAVRQSHRDSLHTMEQNVLLPMLDRALEKFTAVPKDAEQSRRAYERLLDQANVKASYQVRFPDGVVEDGSTNPELVVPIGPLTEAGRRYFEARIQEDGTLEARVIRTMSTPTLREWLRENPASMLDMAFFQATDAAVRGRALRNKRHRGNYDAEILSLSLRILFPQAHDSGVKYMDISVGQGEKKILKYLAAIYGVRQEPIVDMVRYRIVVDTHAFQNPDEATQEARKIFHRFSPERGGDRLYIGENIKPIRMREYLDPEGAARRAERLGSREKHENNETSFGHDKTGIQWTEPHRLRFYGVGDLHWLPGMEVQVTTSATLYESELHPRHTKAWYVNKDTIETMLDPNWTDAATDAMRLFHKVNPFGTLYDGRIPSPEDPRANYFAERLHYATLIWEQVLPKLREVPEDRRREAIEQELAVTKNLARLG